MESFLPGQLLLRRAHRKVQTLKIPHISVHHIHSAMAQRKDQRGYEKKSNNRKEEKTLTILMVLMKKRRMKRTKCGSIEDARNSESLSSSINSATIATYDQVIMCFYFSSIKESHREGIRCRS